MRTAARNEFVGLVKRLDNFLVRLDEAIRDVSEIAEAGFAVDELIKAQAAIINATVRLNAQTATSERPGQPAQATAKPVTMAAWIGLARTTRDLCAQLRQAIAELETETSSSHGALALHFLMKASRYLDQAQGCLTWCVQRQHPKWRDARSLFRVTPAHTKSVQAGELVAAM